MHLDPEQLERTLHGELRPEDGLVREHLAECQECRLRVSEAEQDEASIMEQLRRLDHRRPSPAIRISSGAPRRSGWSRPQRLAAGLALTVAAAGAAYAVPGSPLPRAVHHVVSLLKGTNHPAPAASPRVSATPRSQSGIAVAPGNHFVIVFSGAVPAGSASLSLTQGEELLVRSLDGATFHSDVDRLLVESKTPGATFEVEIPRSAPSVEIRVGGRVVFRKDSSRIVTSAPISKDGSYRLMLGN
jgi:anti-sigma factor RsiW